ncbi:MAG: 5-methylthioadenosine phosphorylase [Eubacteriales bacterium]|nr:5-methylthioadenosine phosphorylase [Eubacteriales bacterium]MDN5364458.1 5-methylthioadenosine phosphorylase [Eubacteriales bacterium]
MATIRADMAIIGGSSTFSLAFPEDTGREVQILEKNFTVSTPYGESPPFKLFSYAGRTILTVKMHGWRQGVSRADASRQIFWVFREAGVKEVLAEGGVGSINHLLRPRDLMVVNDYMDYSMRKDVGLDSGYLLIMRHAFCPRLRQALLHAAEKVPGRRVFDRGVYVCTDGRHFESPAEVASYRILGGDVVGQSAVPEVYLAREIGACYARIDMVVNYGEGVVKEWEHEELKDIFYNEAGTIANLLLEAVTILPTVTGHCECAQLRKPTLLREEKEEKEGEQWERTE